MQGSASGDPNTFAAVLSFDTPLEYAAWDDPNDLVTYHPGAVSDGSVHVENAGADGHLSFTVDANLIVGAQQQPGAVLCADQLWHVLDNGMAGQY